MLKLFSGTANPALSREISALLKVPLSKSSVIRFDNSEIKVIVEEKVKDADCMVIQPTTNPTDTRLMELFFFADALKRQEAKKIMAAMPYFGYSRQNIQHQVGECVSTNVVIKFLEFSGFSYIFTIDLHDEATEGIFSIPFKNLTALPILAKEVKKYLGNKTENCVVVSPDQGGVERTRKFAQYFDNRPIVVIEKKRDLKHIHRSSAVNIFGDVTGKTAIIVDDIITSGGTLVNAANLCLRKGAKEVLAAVVHHDFSPKSPKIIQDSKIKIFFTTNTIALEPGQKFKKLKEVSVATIIAQEIKNIA